MTKRFCSLFFMMLCLMVGLPISAAFKDIKIDLTDGNLLTETEISEKTVVTFGVVIADNGTATRVLADDATANIVITGKYHSNEHGWGDFSATVAVGGPVKVGMGTCAWGGDVTVKNGSETVATFNTNTGACYHNNKTENIAYGVYKGSEATTLTISGGAYTPYLSVVEAAAEDLKTDYEVTYSLGDVTDVQGTILPANIKVEAGKTFVVPSNFTLYKENHTLTAWTDGTNVYKVGEEVAPKAALALTPVFTANTVTLADRDAEAEVLWSFRRDQGAPVVAYQNKDGIYVAQATVKGQVIDVKLDFSTTPGKFNNASNTDWAQVNTGTKFTIPSCKGAVVSMEAYNPITTTTIDGQSDYTSGNTVSYTIANTAETIDIVIGDGSYYRFIKVVLPVVQDGNAGKTYTNEAATVTFPMLNPENLSEYTVTPDGVFSTVSADIGDLELVYKDGNLLIGDITDENAASTGVKGLRFKPSGTTKAINWFVRPAAGLTFTPTKVSGYVNRNGTDAENCLTVSARKADGETIALGTWTALRSGKTSAQKPYDSEAIYKYDITLTADQQAALAGSEGFYLVNGVGVGATKDMTFGNIVIEGVISGTVADVEKFTLSAKSSPEGAGEITVYPKNDEYEAGTEVKVSAVENFGYDFVNWTDAEGNVVTEEPVFTYTVTANSELTANFKAVETYELALTVEGGANLYMVSLAPEPTIVDGKNMYEEGTKVMMSAASNPILTFASWSNGETAAQMAVTMDENKSFVASYAAVDYIVGWDFFLRGNSGRAADFYAADNDAVSLVLRNDAGDQQGWLDKSQEAASGYEGRPAAVNWRTGASNGDVGHFYWQTMFNASAFTDLKLITSMVYNYNAHTTQNVEYSLDGETWIKIGDVVLEGAKNWKDAEFDFPAEANNQPKVYLRWKSDLTSKIDGTASANDGISLGASFIVGTAKLVDDGKAPALVSSVPVNNGTGASANGKIVLTFDEKIKLTDNAKATLNGVELTPTVNGKTVICEYKGLDYSAEYTFTLAKGSVADLTDNVIDTDIVIAFQTKVKPAVTKALYDFVVPRDGSITEALAAANARGTSATERFRIFVCNGNYVFDTKGETTGGDGVTYPDPRSYLTSPYVSFIGESMEGVVITNKTPDATWDNGFGTACPLEGIGKGDVLIIQKNGHDAYFQNLTMKSSMGDAHGRDIVLNDQSNRTIFKDACLWGYQDTYVSNSDAGKFYFEGGVIRGRTDYLCGKGDVYYNGVTLQQCGTGGYIAVPSKAKNYGYVFDNCYIKKETGDVTFYLGRPWGSGTPTAQFINTKMDANAIGNGWADMSGGWPKRFAEYNSYLVSGTSIDLSGRRTSWTDKDGVEHANDPILTIEDVEKLSLANVMGQDDDWDPTAYTEQASAPTNVVLANTTLTWDNSNYAILWAVCKDGKVVDFVLEPTYTVDDTNAKWSVRAANEMGGLGEAAAATVDTGISFVETSADVVTVDYYTVDGLKVGKAAKGMLIEVKTLSSGETQTTKIIR